jgi:MFS transporter, YNFM family, putative membrane transport protein
MHTTANPTEKFEGGFGLPLVAVMLAGMCTFLSVYCTQPLLPFLRDLFHATEVEVSLTVSATIFAVALTAPLIGLLAERYGRKKVIVPALFGMTVPTLLASTASSLHALILWRFLQGIFVPGVIAVMMAYIGEEWQGRGVGRTMAAYVTGTVIGGFLGRFISGIVATHINWRASFLFIGGINLVGAVLVRQWLPLAKNFVKAPHLGHALSDARTHMKNPRLLATFGLGFTVLFALVGAFTYANFYLSEPPFHLGPAELGSVFLVYLLGVVITPLSGRYLDHHGFRKTAVLAFTMSVVGLVLTLAHSLVAVIAGLAVFSSGVFISQAAATVQTGVIAGRGRSSAAGLYVTFYYLGGSAGATATGWAFMRGGWPACIVLLIAALAVSLLLATLSSRGVTAHPVAEVMQVSDD